jgi:hypothetical protein
MMKRMWARVQARLIADARRAHRYWSVRLCALGAGFSTGWIALPADMRAAIPGGPWISLLMFLAIALARVADQPGLRR